MVTLLAYGIVFWYYDIQLALVFVMMLLGYGLWSLYFLKKQLRWDHQRFQRESDTQRTIWQLVRGIVAIKDNLSENKHRTAWAKLQHKLFKIQHAQLALLQKQRYGALFLHQLGSLLLLFLSARLVIEGQLTLGAILSIQFIIGQVGLPLGQIAQFFVEVQAARLSLERMEEVHTHHVEEMKGAPPKAKGSNNIEDLTYRNALGTLSGLWREHTIGKNRATACFQKEMAQGLRCSDAGGLSLRGHTVVQHYRIRTGTDRRRATA